ncbi:tetraspanin-16-like [Ruditapes philippinarum]|uniref:tetraspanin-16-like n=1 Tax=Ruditapes philippinarum TaxID=129788 RepID=UPI00295AC306|nr:tetraspanin-16-like [Ruditapes philippinarum]XP_060607734.1 tetraspanin-16-like [Ruditapes philippinarum]XP_060607741.1 tetraspanin-16-like [Ruditapes philippinarum]XP_060607748.1 tetraspanin-16-like [Ruditapes philippinarum]XP_060607756.1 tetraspanin-16-like [Ruditapes philippinarum]
MGFISTLGRVFLVVVNIFFLIIGLVFFALGMFVRFGTAILNDYVDGVKESLESSAGSSGFGTVDLSNFDISDLLFGVALALIFFGLFLIIISVLGCCGGCCKIKFMLIGYVIICIVLLIGQIIIIGILYGSPDTFHDPAKKKLKDGIQSDYAGLNGTDIVSIGWNVVMQKVKCCGVDSYADFTGASNWISVYTSYTLKTPLACCKTLPSSTDFSCADSTATTANNYLETGCYDKIWEDTLGNTAIMVGSLVGVAVFQLLLILFGIVILCSMKKNKTGNKDF